MTDRPHAYELCDDAASNICSLDRNEWVAICKQLILKCALAYIYGFEQKKTTFHNHKWVAGLTILAPVHRVRVCLCLSEVKMVRVGTKNTRIHEFLS